MKGYFVITADKNIDWLKILREFGFSDIEKYSYIPRVSGYTDFFIANYNGEKVFVKCGKGDYYAKKEHDVSNLLYSKNSEHFIKSVMYRTTDSNKMFLATRYIDGKTLDAIDYKKCSSSQLNKMFDSLIEIGEILAENKYIFRDFNKRNLMVEKDGNIRLFDTQHFIGEGYSEPEENIKNLKKLRGTNKKLRPFPYVWDDMFAINKLLKEFPKNKIDNYKSKIKLVKNMINKNRYYFFDNKIPFESYMKVKITIFYKICNELFKPFRRFL